MGFGSGSGAEKKEAGQLKRLISVEEVGKHRTPDDAWMICKGKVYDISGWKNHPGGSVVFTHAGDDFTDVFAAFHPSSSYEWLEKFYIGDVDVKSITKPKQQQDFEQAYRDLRVKLEEAGLFEASIPYYIFKISFNVAMWALSVACVTQSDSPLVHFIGATIMGLFWQQCGWLAHDFLHHQVFKNRDLNNLLGVLIGNLFQGFSVGWWKSKHNAHHAVPNLHESSPDSHDGDPDIDTMPLLAWSLQMAKGAKDTAMARFFVKYQAIMYFPLLIFARLAWAQQSYLFVFGGNLWSTKGAKEDRERNKIRSIEKIGLLGYYAYNVWLMSRLPPLEALGFFLWSQMTGGFFLALVFGVGHNGMSVYSAAARPDWWKLQVSTTRNITSNWFVDWFCGGLQYQVEHHLFPTIPRHNLGKVNQIVTAFCKEQGVSYHEAGMYDGNMEVLQHLEKVSIEFIKEFPAM